MSKYLEAARQVADHLVLKRIGFRSPHPMLVETDRKNARSSELLIFMTANQLISPSILQPPGATNIGLLWGSPRQLCGHRRAGKVSPRYLATIWRASEQSRESRPARQASGNVGRSAGAKGNQPEIRPRRLRADARLHRQRSAGTRKSCSPMWRRRVSTPIFSRSQCYGTGIAAHRRDFDLQRCRSKVNRRAGLRRDPWPHVRSREAEDLKKPLLPLINERQEDPDLVVPAGGGPRYEAAFARFSSVFPTAFCLREHGGFIHYLDG